MVKAAAILGASGILAAAVLVVGLVLGMRWAIDSALASHLPALNETVTQTGRRLETSVESSATRVVAGVDGGAEEVAATVSTVGKSLATMVDASSDQLATSLDTGVAQTNRTITVSSSAVNQTLQQSFEKPLLIHAPRALPIQGPEEDGPPLKVNASLLGGGEGGGGDEGSKGGN